MKNFDILTLGNANIDQFLAIKENANCRLNPENHELCIASGAKILVEDSQFLLGGGASNLAVGLSRMGFKAGLFAEIGSDEFSSKIFNFLSKEQVDLSNLIQTQTPSSFSVCINFKEERNLFVNHVEREHNFIFNDLYAPWFYIGGLGEKWEEAYKKAISFVKEKNIKLVFAPGTTQIESGLEKIKPTLISCDIFFLNKEEAVRLTGEISNFPASRGEQFPISNDANLAHIKELLNRLKELGPKIVVITDGMNGSYSIDEAGVIRSIGLFPCQVVEKTGAGDAYATGFVAATMLDLSIEESMRWGAVNASAVIEKIGAQSGLLSKEEIEKRLRDYLEFKAEEL